LTLDNAPQHLYHFCARLGSNAYVDTRPEVEFTNVLGQITAEITLPISVDPTVRKATSLQTWKTERMARKDAAFEAYKALYLHGLVNENLLPVQEEEDNQAAQYQIPDDRPSLVPVSQTLDPWSVVAQSYESAPDVWYCTLLEVKTPGEEPMRIILLTPTAMHEIPDILLHWNESKQYTVTSSSLYGTSLADIDIGLLRSITWKILHSVFGVHIIKGIDDFLCLLAPCDSLGYMMTENELYEWNSATEGQRPASKLLIQGNLDTSNWGLTSQQGDARKFMPMAIEPSESSEYSSVNDTLIQAVRLPKRRDFLHTVYDSANKNEAYTRVESLVASSCLVENLPTRYAILALLLPSILHKLEVYMIADTLRTTILKPAEFEVSDLPIIITALTSSAVDKRDNYQRMEFLGDCILKFVTSLHLMAANLIMPEGILTGKKGKLVSNGYLARATLAAGLDKFIFYKNFTGAKWKPRYISQTLADIAPPPKQEKSSKLIADVIESLIGASYLVGGFPKAFACMQALLPLEKWTPIPEANETLCNAAPSEDTVTNLALVEKLLGHTFNKKQLLLESLTHSTFRGPNVHCSYERFEFLGDAVLDYIISKRLYTHESNLPHWKMHGVRTAMVNAAFLTYCMFETTVVEELTNKSTLQPEAHHRALWQFLRSSSPELIAGRTSALQQHAEARSAIATALAHDSRFPWHALSLTDPPKFLSDIVESVIGALYIDSHGSIPVCEEFVRRLGILPCLERILKDGVDCWHPKERINTLAADKGIKYVRVTGDQNGAGKGNGSLEKGYKVQVRIGGNDVGGVVEGVKRLQTETIAAWKVIALLEGGGADGVPTNVTGEEEEEGEDDEEDDEFFDAEEGGGVSLEDSYVDVGGVMLESL
jgi:dsRNA-specific ribonuclease